MNVATQRNIGALVSVVTSVQDAAATAGTVNGATIDRVSHSMTQSCVMHTVLISDAGGPSAISVQSTLQHSPDGANWSNYEPDGVNAAQASALTAVATENSLPVDLTLADRYIRVSTVVTLTGGTSPTAAVVADLILGGENTLPAV
jgi:hypothetical protein